MLTNQEFMRNEYDRILKFAPDDSAFWTEEAKILGDRIQPNVLDIHKLKKIILSYYK